MKIEYIIDEIKLHIKRIESILPDIELWLPLTYKDFDNVEKVKTLDSFIFRFIKVQDKIGEKLFPALLSLLQEYDRSMPFIDILNKLEKLRILPSANEWIEYRNLRNILTHEYPDNEDEIIEAISLAVDAYKNILGIFGTVIKIVSQRERKDTH